MGHHNDQSTTDDNVIVRLLQLPGDCLLKVRQAQIDNISYSNVDDTQEPLVFLLELLLIKHLDHKDGVFVGVEGEGLVPIRVERLLCSRRGLCLRTINSENGKGIWTAKHIPLVKRLSSNHFNRDCSVPIEIPR